jgi:spore germination cell wall hydrolase CwlJ-like protein
MKVIQDDIWGALCIFAEARGEPFKGQVAVGNVVRNRMREKYSSDGTVVGTVLKPLQFSWTNTHDAQRTRVLSVDMADPKWSVAVEAWEDSLSKNAVPPETVLYHADWMSRYPVWTKKAKEVAHIGRHIFYKEA